MFGFAVGKTDSKRATAANPCAFAATPEKQTLKSESEPRNIRVSADRVLFEERAGFGTEFVVYLGEFFRALGGRDDHVTDALQRMAEAIFRDRLLPEDTFCFDPLGYFTISIAGDDRAAARERIEAIVDHLGMRAVGERFTPWRVIRAMEGQAFA